ERPRQDDDDVAEDLDERAEGLEDHEVREGHQAQAPVARIEEHPPVTPQALEHAAVPAIALAEEDLPARRDLGPADRIGDEDDPVLAPGLAHRLVQTHDELE